MVVKRFYDEKLAQASYLVGCSATGESIVIDANRDIAQYIAAARAEGLRVTAVTETHIHADYLSGARELAQRAGARLYLSDEGTADWKYQFADEATLVKGGDSIRIGNVRLDVIHTPGHTPEHVSFLLTDEPASSEPMGAFTGDFIFVGDVGRPDLLERAAKIANTMEVGARQLYVSVAAFAKRDDGLLIWPGHGAGSACGKSLGGSPVSSLGYEKASNWAFGALSEKEFVDAVLAGQPAPPPYFARMKKLNKEGPAILGDFRTPRRISFDELHSFDEAQLVDVRDPKTTSEFLPGAVLLPEDRAFIKWAGWLLDYERPIVVIADQEDEALLAVRDLAMIGLDEVKAWLPGSELQGAIPFTPTRWKDMEDWGGSILDVRWPDEFEEGHAARAVNVPLAFLAERAGEVPQGNKLAIYCGTGSRSRIALGILAAKGFRDLCNVEGNYDEYMSMGGSVEACCTSR